MDETTEFNVMAASVFGGLLASTTTDTNDVREIASRAVEFTKVLLREIEAAKT